MGKKKQHDPFDPEQQGVRCPSCLATTLSCDEDAVRKCRRCGRVERWLKPSRKELGSRRYQRLVARQRKKFGDLDLILFQWVADPEPDAEEDGD